MIKVGCVFYYANLVFSCKSGANEPNLAKIGLSRDEKQTQATMVSYCQAHWMVIEAAVAGEGDLDSQLPLDPALLHLLLCCGQATLPGQLVHPGGGHCVQQHQLV